MHRLVFIALAAATLPACLDFSGTPYEVKVDWSSSGASTEKVIARITYDDQEIIANGTLASYGHAGTALVSGETYGESIEICVELGTYEWVDHQTGFGCESGDYECDPPVREFVAKTFRCETVTLDDNHVQMTF
jgi:hypothetical protein